MRARAIEAGNPMAIDTEGVTRTNTSAVTLLKQIFAKKPAVGKLVQPVGVGRVYTYRKDTTTGFLMPVAEGRPLRPTGNTNSRGQPMYAEIPESDYPAAHNEADIVNLNQAMAPTAALSRETIGQRSFANRRDGYRTRPGFAIN